MKSSFADSLPPSRKAENGAFAAEKDKYVDHLLVWASASRQKKID
jgi:hypothetical protein